MKRADINPTKIIEVSQDIDDIEQELREMTKEALLIRLNYEEKDPKVMKLIKKIIKEKEQQE